ncbi:MAG: hypothetical protein EZS28_031198 [Streblomastix strix]|uniref:Uncharacterized protein n=1 Tax=Streblomastix strix TaxID=222440 RepID=A0A5J4UU75_9EUKA|nr:MAG: hypothetical protein EZS28_031198 [Streblomastix strix]
MDKADTATKLDLIVPVAIIQEQAQIRQERNKLIHSSENSLASTVAFDPPVSDGIVRFEGVFENLDGWMFNIGIADVSTVFGANKVPAADGNKDNIVCYLNVGTLQHRDGVISGNVQILEKQKIALEVNMVSIPHTLHFFVDGIEQPLSIFNIPAQIRFWIYLSRKDSQFTITRFNHLSSSSAKDVEGSKKLEWGKLWQDYGERNLGTNDGDLFDDDEDDEL